MRYLFPQITMVLFNKKKEKQETNNLSESKIFKCLFEKILKLKHNLRHAN